MYKLSFAPLENRPGEVLADQLALLRIRRKNGIVSWIASSEERFPLPYTILAAELHLRGMTGDVVQAQGSLRPRGLYKDSAGRTILVMRRMRTGIWSLHMPSASLQERLGIVLVVNELLRSTAVTESTGSDWDRVGLDEILTEELVSQQPEDGEVDFAFILSTYENEDGEPTGWSYRASARPNPFELLGALSVEIEELKLALMNEDDDLN